MNKREAEIIKKAVVVLKKSLNPASIIMFGSRAKKRGNKHCDFDFAVDCPLPSTSLKRKIEEEMEAIAGLYTIDIVYIKSVDRDFAGIILNTGRTIYEKRS